MASNVEPGAPQCALCALLRKAAFQRHRAAATCRATSTRTFALGVIGGLSRTQFFRHAPRIPHVFIPPGACPKSKTAQISRVNAGGRSTSGPRTFCAAGGP